MADILRVMADGLEFLRPFAVTGNLPVTDFHHQVCHPFAMFSIAQLLFRPIYDVVSRPESITF